MASLYKLPNGNWVRADSVTRIVSRDTDSDFGRVIKPRVIIHIVSGENVSHEVIECGTLQEAVRIRDVIADGISTHLRGIG